MTRRWRLQLSRVDHWNSLNRRAGWPLVLLSLRGRGELGRDLANQTFVLGQAKQKIDAVELAPTHQRLARKPRIGTQHNAHFRPAGADLRDNARHLLYRAGRRVDVGGSLFGRQQMQAAEDV